MVTKMTSLSLSRVFVTRINVDTVFTNNNSHGWSTWGLFWIVNRGNIWVTELNVWWQHAVDDKRVTNIFATYICHQYRKREFLQSELRGLNQNFEKRGIHGQWIVDNDDIMLIHRRNDLTCLYHSHHTNLHQCTSNPNVLYLHHYLADPQTNTNL